MSVPGRLIFVYNADSGLFNLLADVAHKLLAPASYECALCTLTHSPFAMRVEWRRFLAELGVETAFLHRDQWHRDYPNQSIPLPSVLCQTEAGLSVCVDAAALRCCDSLDALKALITERCLPNLR